MNQETYSFNAKYLSTFITKFKFCVQFFFFFICFKYILVSLLQLLIYLQIFYTVPVIFALGKMSIKNKIQCCHTNDLKYFTCDLPDIMDLYQKISIF